MQPAPPAQPLQRRRSSVADAFGKTAVVQGLQRAASIVKIVGEGSPTHPTFAAQVSGSAPPKAAAPPLFVFRHHQLGKKSLLSPEGRSVATDSITSPYHPLDAQVRQDREQRKSIIAASMHEPSLAHLVVETRKEKLPLEQLEASHSVLNTLAHSVNRRQSVSSPFVAFAESEPEDQEVEATNELWAAVATTNSERRECRKQLLNSSLQERVKPRWWRHLSLRDFSDYLSPGLFNDDELERGSDSDDEGAHNDGENVSKQSVGGESLDVQSPATERPRGNNTASDQSVTAPPRSNKSMVIKKSNMPLHLSSNLLNPWTQHVTQRPPSHWTTPRRHGVHGGKSVGEIGTLTTVASRDFIAAANSLIGICQAEERLLRMTIERSERSDAAKNYYAACAAAKPQPPIADPTLMVLVAEVQSREDILEHEVMSLEWLVTATVLLPAQVAIAERDQNRAVNFYLQVLKEGQPKNQVIPMDEQVAALLRSS